MVPEKVEVIYYELLRMEQRISERSLEILNAGDEIASALNRFEIMQKELLKKMEEIKIK